jgi:TPR repeat protein
MVNLGSMYYSGLGVGVDSDQAVNWYRKAAEAGNAEGMNNLGWMYDAGYGVKTDSQRAIVWYRKAAQLGNQKAKDNLKRLGASP